MEKMVKMGGMRREEGKEARSVLLHKCSVAADAVASLRKSAFPPQARKMLVMQ